MLKRIIGFAFLVVFIPISFSAEKEKKLIYTQEDFNKKLEEEVVKKLGKVLDKGVVGFSKDLLEKEKRI